jgi:O-antigen/teichoic acid export membrane protein
LKSTPIDQPFSLRRNFSWALVGNIFYSACQGGMLIVLARLGTAEMVGAFTFALAVTAPLFMFSNLQLRVVQATDAHTQFTFNDYLGLRLVSTLLALGGLLGINLLFPSSHCAVILVIGVAKAVESISDVCAGFMQQQESVFTLASDGHCSDRTSGGGCCWIGDRLGNGIDRL